jgi:serine/threonine-protein kinase
MAIDSVADLLATLGRVQLLAPDQVDEIARELGPHYHDPSTLADYLVEIDWLTAYQRKLLFEGRWEELRLGPFQLLERLGEGGLSEVFKAWDAVKGRVVALKVLQQHLAGRGDAVPQLTRELQAITRLCHANIIKTFDAHRCDELHYFAMEYVEGMDLRQYVQKVGPLPIAQASEYIRQTAQGLQHAHQLRLVHRDVKPANLFLINPPLPEPPADGAAVRRAEPSIKIIDWGWARLKPAEDEAACAPTAELLDEEKGKLIGTADFIAPEQAHDPTLVDVRADIYSLGCTFYYLLTGKTPFDGVSILQKLLQHQEADPPQVRALRPDVPEELNALVLRMMAKRPEDRFQIPLLVVAPLRRFCAGGSGIFPNLKGVPRPGSSSIIRPASSSSLPRPASSSNLTPRAGASNLDRPASSAALPPPPGDRRIRPGGGRQRDDQDGCRLSP